MNAQDSPVLHERGAQGYLGNVWWMGRDRLRSALQPGAAAIPSAIKVLLGAIEDHIEAEQEHLDHYRALEGQTKNPTARVILRLILADEEQRHKTLRLIAHRLSDELHWGTGAAWVGPPGPEPEIGPKVVDETRRFREREAEDSRVLTSLAGESADLHGGLFSAMLEAMSRDSQKHAHLLAYLERYLEGQL